MNIYFIPDSEGVTAFPESANLNFGNAFDLKEFKEIEMFFPENTSFVEDFRLYSEDVSFLYKKLLNSNAYKNANQKVLSFSKLEKLCKNTYNEKIGLIGFSD